MKIRIIDESDMSVGIRELVVLDASIDENFAEHLEENDLTKKFADELKALVDKYFEPEIRYFADVEK